jgi:hypothetical protein
MTLCRTCYHSIITEKAKAYCHTTMTLCLTCYHSITTEKAKAFECCH